MASEPILRLRGLAVAAGGVRLAEGIDLELGQGEIVVIGGPSGCGKTTLLRSIAGLLDPAEGELTFKGKTPETFGWPRFRRKAMLVAQRPTLRDATVRDNLALPFAYATAEAPFPEERAREFLDRLHVGADRMTQRARDLSEGQQQRVCLIRALLTQPEVALLDEPTSALDPESTQAVRALVSDEAHTRGMAALVVMHDGQQGESWSARRLDLTQYAPRARALA